MYNKKIMQLFINPNNCGLVHGANASTYITHEQSGDIIKTYMVISDDEIIEDAGFKAFGNPALIAILSVYTDLVKGKRIEEVRNISNQDILDVLIEVPEYRQYCLDFARKAIEDTILDYFDRKEKEEKKLNKKMTKQDASTDEIESEDDMFGDEKDDMFFYETEN